MVIGGRNWNLTSPSPPKSLFCTKFGERIKKDRYIKRKPICVNNNEITAVGNYISETAEKSVPALKPIWPYEFWVYPQMILRCLKPKILFCPKVASAKPEFLLNFISLSLVATTGAALPPFPLGLCFCPNGFPSPFMKCPVGRVLVLFP